MSDDLFGMFRMLRNPEADARVLGSVMPSDYFPKAGEYFRVRFATIASRSFMGDVWECVETQDGAALGRKVLDTYTGAEGKSIGSLYTFAAGDMIFYDCTKMWEALKATPSRDSASPEQT